MSKVYAMQIPLFNLCNLNCKFCYQNSYGKRTNKFDLSYLEGLPEKVIDAHRKLFNDRGITDLYPTIYGGEPFNDALPVSIFDEYKKFCDRFTKLLKDEFNITTHYIWLTNGGVNRYDLIDDLLEYTHGTINTSYDPCDRFANEKQRANWWRTLNYYRDRMNMVTMVTTKANINAVLSGKDNFLLEVPKNIPIDVSYYFPVADDYKEFCIDDDDIYNLFVYGLDNGLFNWVNIANLIKTFTDPKHVVRNCNCLDTSFCFQNEDNSMTPLLTCYSTIDFAMHHNVDDYYKNEDYDAIVNTPDEKRRIIGIKRRGCLYCEYSDRCQRMCYMLPSHKDYKQNEVCPFIQLYTYIKKHPYLIDKYKAFCKEVTLNVTKER